MKKILAAFLLVCLTVACFAACAPTPAQTKVVTYGIDGDIDNFNPMTNQQTNYITLFCFNVYEPLWHLNPDMVYEMDLATNVKQVDDVTYEITLREGVKFHNGQSFTAADVIHTINYIRNEANGAWRASQYNTVESITTDGDYKLTIHLSAPTPALLDSLAYTPIFCKSDDPAAMTTTANGTGAFKFIEWVPNDHMSFEKFPEYWDAQTVSVEKLQVKPFSDYSVAISNMQAGAVDVLNRISVDDSVSIAGKQGLQVVESKSSNTVDLFEIGRHNVEAFSDPKVLQAMLLALDTKTLNTAIYGGKGQVLTSCYPFGTKYHKDVLSNEYNIQKAKDLLAQTPYANGFTFDCEILAGFPSGEMAALMWKDALAELGITMNVKVEEMSVWLESYLARSYDMIWNQYGMAGSDPATFNSIIIEQLYPYQCADLTKLQQLVDAGKATGDEAKRTEIYAEIQEIIGQYLPVYPYISVPLLYGTRDAVSGLQVNGMGHAFLKYLKVSG